MPTCAHTQNPEDIKPVLWKVFLRPPSIHRKKYLSMKPLNALLRFLPPFYQSLGKQSACFKRKN